MPIPRDRHFTPYRRVVLAIILLAASALADTSKISPDLQPLLNDTSRTVNVIIQYSSPPQQCTNGGLLNLGGLVCTVVHLVGGVVKVVFSLLNAVSATMSISDVIRTSDQADVEYISLDRPVAATVDYSVAAVGAAGMASSYGLDGSGIGIAVIDSGIYPHADLQTATGTGSRIVYRQSFIGGTLPDDFGHGTHVAGIAAGNGKSSNLPGSPHVLRGIAPNASVLDLRVLDRNGASNDSAVISALQKAVELKSKYNVRIINLSLGRPIYESCSRDPLCKAVEMASKNGIVVVVAAGNLGRNSYGTILAPANSPRAITVGAMKTMGTYSSTDDMIASYSSKGPTYIDQTIKPDLVAPGNLVMSLLAPGSTLAFAFPANMVAPAYYKGSPASPALYMQLSGTSMAAPVVSGAVALMLQKDPWLTPDTVKTRLMKTASKTFPLFSTATDPATNRTYVSAYDMFTVGAGYLNVAAALANSDVAMKSSASPYAQYGAQTLAGRVVLTPSLVWNSSAAWSLPAVWGSTVLSQGTTIWRAADAWSTSAAWGTNVAWGDSGSSGTNVAWGDSGRGEK
jgi:serine protease AprX